MQYIVTGISTDEDRDCTMVTAWSRQGYTHTVQIDGCHKVMLAVGDEDDSVIGADLADLVAVPDAHSGLSSRSVWTENWGDA